MGFVYAEVKIGDPEGKSILTQRMLIDTGATFTCIPPSLARQLNLATFGASDVTLADGREVVAANALAYMEINGRGDVVQVRVFDVLEPIVGVFTLEVLGLAVDPTSGEIKPTRGYTARA